MHTTRDGNPAASHCASRTARRTPWIDTRSKVSVTVVNAPTTSSSPACRISCNANALSLPLDHEISAFARTLDRPSLPGVPAEFVETSASLTMGPCSVIPLEADRPALPLTRCRRGTFCCGLAVPERADLSQRGLRSALAALPSAIDRAPQRLVRCFAREKHTADGLVEDLSRRLPTRRCG